MVVQWLCKRTRVRGACRGLNPCKTPVSERVGASKGWERAPDAEIGDARGVEDVCVVLIFEHIHSLVARQQHRRCAFCVVPSAQLNG